MADPNKYNIIFKRYSGNDDKETYSETIAENMDVENALIFARGKFAKHHRNEKCAIIIERQFKKAKADYVKPKEV